jgi:hypothetical protein
MKNDTKKKSKKDKDPSEEQTLRMNTATMTGITSGMGRHYSQIEQSTIDLNGRCKSLVEHDVLGILTDKDIAELKAMSDTLTRIGEATAKQREQAEHLHTRVSETLSAKRK